MKEHPILFNTPMVQAILNSSKTQTRRIVKSTVKDCRVGTYSLNGKVSDIVNVQPDGDPYTEITCPFGQVGDLLYVREKHAITLGKVEPETCISYFADSWHSSTYPKDYTKSDNCQWYDPDLAKELKWKPSIHMPKAAARIWLRITEIKVERLNNISEEDAKAEGVLLHKLGRKYFNYAPNLDRVTQFVYNCYNARESFRSLWNSINKYPHTFRENPWVWVVKFEVLSTTGKTQ